MFDIGLSDTLSGNVADRAHRRQSPARGRVPVSNCLWANRRPDKSHSVTPSPSTICTFAVNEGGWGDRDERQRVWRARRVC